MPFFPFIDLDIFLSVYRLSIPILTIGPAFHLNLHSRPAVANALECALIFTFTLTDPPHDMKGCLCHFVQGQIPPSYPTAVQGDVAY